ncbi:glycoside hydrolase family 32 protein [Mongoliibacter ruber]|uniref:Fructan beta-fructosidase n=1 Tax=Mongoliibacter ruber TaxID=1750599 RepID=A0A2T0WMT4_9BACT|nr:glycoside hydrolase family 32 protein [Mongoliibacter ruber]PRY88011.1 fructan beta-fructosidase [Mongoliibacter ruber]
MKTSLTYIFAILFGLSFSCSEKITELETTQSEFNEPFRPQYHFTPPSNWMNDPNGMVYWEGEYHLFYQYHPDGNTWGPMHWGHAISEDLVHWEHQPIALFPDEHGTIFSGSAVADVDNTSGLGTTENPPLVAIFTYHDAEGEKAGRDDFQTQGIAFSTDKGRTWSKYEGNPVLESPGIKDFRDPKVAWIDGQWIMSLAVKDRISFYSSDNLIDWKHESDFAPDWAAYGGVWECPDLFPLKTPEGEEKWILFVSINPGGPQGGSATQYFIGDFDGKNFTTETTEVKWLDWGADNYAGVTWSNVPESDGRRLFIGWMSNWQYAQEVPTEVWRSAMTIPRSLDLFRDGEGYSVASKPVKELGKLRSETQSISGQEASLNHELVELEFAVTDEDFRIEFQNEENERLILEKTGEFVVLDRGLSGITSFNADFTNTQTAPLGNIQVKNLRVFLDRSSVEVFINDGELALTALIFPNSPYSKIQMQGLGSGKAHYLKSIW